MFIETHSDNEILMTFLRSTNIQAYPCGRRRSALVENDFSNDGTISEDEKYRFPFDPEARLNTEANNRKHSSLNGYTQTYLISDWKSYENSATKLVLALNGYLFTIELDENYRTSDTFGRKLLQELNVTSADKIYANILLEDVKLLSTQFKDYSTKILRNQSQQDSSNNIPSEALDLPTSSAVNSASALKNANNYYFSGLSFSTVPLTSINEKSGNIGKTRSSELKTVEYTFGSTKETVSQTLVSLCILKKNTNDKWVVNEEARLPKIEHGETEDSIVVTGDTTLKSNLYVEDNINVGNPTNPVEDDNGGNIVAKYDITAEQDLKAGRNLEVTGAALVDGEVTIGQNTTVEKNLLVGTRTDTTFGDSEIGSIIATKIDAESIVADGIEVGEELTAPAITVGDENELDGKLTVNGNTEILGHTDVDTLEASKITVGTLPTEGDDESYAIEGYPATSIIDGDIITSSIDAKFAIKTPRLTASGITAGTVNGLDIQQQLGEINADGTANYYDVPVIFLENQNDGSFQLQISRVNKTTKT